MEEANSFGHRKSRMQHPAVWVLLALFAVTVVVISETKRYMPQNGQSGKAADVGNAQMESGSEGTGKESESPVQEYTLNNLYFDTVISIKFDAGSNGNELIDGCNKICRQIQQTFSRTDETSELWAVNHRKTDTVTVSAPIAELVETGLEYYKISGGMFDITVAPLSDLWDFKSENAAVPDKDKIKEAQAKVDASKVHVKGETLSFDSDDTMIDLGALVKGYAADRISSYLKGEGVKSGIINLGGNVLAIGSKEDGSAWKVGIQKPFSTDIMDMVEVTDQTVVTSGVYERYFKQDGVIYHHILDPNTGYPVQDGLWGVSIICDSSLQGDALSTTCLAVGEDKAAEIIGSMDGVKAVFIDDQLNETKAGWN